MSIKTKFKIAAWAVVIGVPFFYWAYTDGLRTNLHVEVVQKAEAAEVCGASCQQLAKLMLGNKLDAMKNDIIDTLAYYENRDPINLPYKYDDNKAGTLPAKDKPSYGCMQYKNSTIQRHNKAIHGTDLSNLDAVLLALDCTKAKALAKEAIFGPLNAIDEWSAATSSMRSQVAGIRAISK